MLDGYLRSMTESENKFLLNQVLDHSKVELIVSLSEIQKKFQKFHKMYISVCYFVLVFCAFLLCDVSVCLFVCLTVCLCCRMAK